MKSTNSINVRKKLSNAIIYVILTLMSIIWILPVIWVIITSFREEQGVYTSYVWPKGFSFINYINLFTNNKQFNFVKWFLNTFFVATVSCIFGTMIVVSISYVLSKLKFKMKKSFMKILLVLGMFPAFMSMIAVYYILKGLNLIDNPLICLILVYSAGAAMQYYIAKGFFDTIPHALDEAAYLDGATKSQVFFKITLPLSKPIIVYTILTTFMAPWMDFIFPSIICGTDYDSYTMALGMFRMLEREFINTFYTQFVAAAVIVSIPIAILYFSMQKYYIEGVTSGAVKG